MKPRRFTRTSTSCATATPHRRPSRCGYCESIACMLAGSEALRSELIERLGPEVERSLRAFVGRCERAPAAFVGKAHVGHATVDSVAEAVRENRTQPILPEHSVGFSDYLKRGGYQLLRACLAGKHRRDDLIAGVDASGLRGLGGAGFRSGQKWRMVSQGAEPRLWPSTATKANPARSKIAIISKRTHTSFWKECFSRPGPWKPRKSTSTCGTNILTSMNCSRRNRRAWPRRLGVSAADRAATRGRGVHLRRRDRDVGEPRRQAVIHAPSRRFRHRWVCLVGRR